MERLTEVYTDQAAAMDQMEFNGLVKINCTKLLDTTELISTLLHQGTGKA
jgi:hypothetical protein